MSPEDAKSTYDDLRRLLAEFKFSWVGENVDALLQAGIPQEFALSHYQESQKKNGDARKGPVKTEKVMGRRAHTEEEKLLLLLDEIERCVIVPIQIADQLPDTLSTPERRVESIELVEPESGETEFRIDKTQSVGGKDVEALAAALQEIRKDI